MPTLLSEQRMGVMILIRASDFAWFQRCMHQVSSPDRVISRIGAVCTWEI